MSSYLLGTWPSRFGFLLSSSEDWTDARKQFDGTWISTCCDSSFSNALLYFASPSVVFTQLTGALVITFVSPYMQNAGY
jgi:hypothetical protein